MPTPLPGLPNTHGFDIMNIYPAHENEYPLRDAFLELPR